MQSVEAIPNMLLAALPGADYRHILTGSMQVTLPFGEVLYEPGTTIKEVYFPSACIVSLLTVVDNHLALEVGLVGREGMVGTPLALGAEASPVRALVQGGGDALRMSGAAFMRALRDSRPLRRGVYGHTHALMGQISRTAACNRFHAVEPRLARWLLLTRDRLQAGDFRMTHVFMASMLGVRREGVSEAAGALQARGLIEYRRGHIKIVDHRRLEAAACSCYGVAASKRSPPAWRPPRSRPRSRGNPERSSK